MFFAVNRRLAELMERFPEYDVTVEETHHTQKKDAPSGTAITLAEGILGNLTRKKKWICGTTTEPPSWRSPPYAAASFPGFIPLPTSRDADLIALRQCQEPQRIGYRSRARREFICGKRGIFTMKDLMGID